MTDNWEQVYKLAALEVDKMRMVERLSLVMAVVASSYVLQPSLDCLSCRRQRQPATSENDVRRALGSLPKGGNARAALNESCLPLVH
jgi:hypothetical protein